MIRKQFPTSGSSHSAGKVQRAAVGGLPGSRWRFTCREFTGCALGSTPGEEREVKEGSCSEEGCDLAHLRQGFSAGLTAAEHQRWGDSVLKGSV